MATIKDLQLLAVEPVHARALLRGRDELATLLGVSVPDNWPCLPQASSKLSNEADRLGTDVNYWRDYFFIDTERMTVVGNGGFKGPPNSCGVVEIDCEIALDHQNRGFATHAAGALLRAAFAHNAVHAVVAHTLPAPNASNRVLHKVGMTFATSVDSADMGKLWRWRLTREMYLAK